MIALISLDKMPWFNLWSFIRPKSYHEEINFNPSWQKLIYFNTDKKSEVDLENISMLVVCRLWYQSV